MQHDPDRRIRVSFTAFSGIILFSFIAGALCTLLLLAPQPRRSLRFKTAPAPHDIETIRNEYRSLFNQSSAFVAISRDDPEYIHPVTHGTGFVATYNNRTFIVTANHVVETIIDNPDEHILIVTKHRSFRYRPPQTKSPTEPTLSRDTDIAILPWRLTTETDITPLTLAREIPSSGAVLATVCNPFHFSRPLRIGTHVDNHERGLERLKTDLLHIYHHGRGIWSGCSGGPLLDTSGTVHGIMVMASPSRRGLHGFAIPSTTLIDQIQAAYPPVTTTEPSTPRQ